MTSSATCSSFSRTWRRSIARGLLVWSLAVPVPGVKSQVSAVPGTASPSAPTAEPRELLKQLDQVSVDSTQIYSLRHVQITRDRVKIYFNRGFLGFFAPVAGEITGAAFSGDGEVLMIPPDPVEKRNLAHFTQSPILEEQFTSAYLRFTDQTARELAARAQRPDPEDVEQPTGFADRLAPLIQLLNPGQSLRVLRDLLGERDLPYFHARLQGVHLGWFEVSDDERQPEPVRLGSVQTREGKLFADVWCSFASRASQGRRSRLTPGPALVRSYKIDTRINSDNSLDGRAELELESQSGADRVLFFELSHRLKVSAVSETSEGRARDVIFFQSLPGAESEAAAPGNNWVVAVLPSPHPVGQTFRLDFAYHGDVIADVGNGVFYVGAHGIWYPNASRMLGARYELTFQYPDRLTLVATGKRTEETTTDGWKHSRWVSDGVFRVAGFNLGAYAEQVRRVGNIAIEAYAAAGVEASLAERTRRAQSSVNEGVPRAAGNAGAPAMPPSSAAAPLDPTALLEDVSDRAARAVRYFETLFGPFPYPRLALAQIPGRFGQGWPELVYLPTLSFLPSSARSELAGGVSNDRENQLFVAHEIAHQWWGNEVGWQTYHDQWISEGFASYAAALELGLDQAGEQRFRELLGRYKRDLLSKNPNGSTVESGGPIWLGERLTNSLNPGGYDAVVYKKACWVLHMLRKLVVDPEPGGTVAVPSISAPGQRLPTGIAQPNERFFRMLREFVATYRGQDASTEDFVHLTARYMAADADLDRNHRLDWFFTDWVFGTGIPTYQLHVTTRRSAPHKFVVEGNIEQSDVPQDFEMLVPLVATYEGDRVVPLGRVAVNDSGGRFQFTTNAKPARVAINEDEILAVVR